MINILTDKTKIWQLDFLFDKEDTLWAILLDWEFISERLLVELVSKLDYIDIISIIEWFDVSDDAILKYEEWINDIEEHFLDYRDAFRTRRI